MFETIIGRLFKNSYTTSLNDFTFNKEDLPYNYDEASLYTFKVPFPINDNNFWRMFRVKYDIFDLFFHKKTNVVFDCKFCIIGRFINDKIIPIDRLHNRQDIINWFDTSKRMERLLKVEVERCVYSVV